MSKGKESRDVRVLIKEVRNVIEAASVDRKQNEKGVNAWVERHRDLFRSSEVMQEQGASSKENKVMIYCLPEFMMGSVECKRWFVPAVTSIGPLHFRCLDGVGVVSMGAVARIKEEAISFIMEKYGDAERQRITESLISDIHWHEQMIKACYSDGTRIPLFLRGDPFVWMMVVDACYLLVVLSVLSQKNPVESKRWPALALLQEKGYRREKVVHDLLKIENQIPLWVVKLVAIHLPGWEPSGNGELSQLVDMQKVLESLCPFSISDISDFSGRVLTLFQGLGLNLPETSRWRLCNNDYQEGTLLDILLLFSVGETTEKKNDENRETNEKKKGTKFQWKVFVELVKVVVHPILNLRALLCKIFENMELRSLTAQSVLPGQHSAPVNLVANLVTLPVQGSFVALAMVVVAMGTVLVALVAWPFMVVASTWQPRSTADTVNLGAHAVLESGVKMNVSTSAAGILSAVYWREEGGQMGLPRICLDELGMVALWNMVALEQLNPEHASKPTPLCNYVCLMSDLLGSADDVFLLENENIIEHVSSSCRDDVVQMWQDLELLATTSSAKAHTDDNDILFSKGEPETYDAQGERPEPIQQAHSLLSKFVKARQHPSSGLRRLLYWINVLRNDYGSSPWLAISTIGAIALLLMTVAQVFCVFYPCLGTKG